MNNDTIEKIKDIVTSFRVKHPIIPYLEEAGIDYYYVYSNGLDLDRYQFDIDNTDLDKLGWIGIRLLNCQVGILRCSYTGVDASFLTTDYDAHQLLFVDEDGKCRVSMLVSKWIIKDRLSRFVNS